MTAAHSSEADRSLPLQWMLYGTAALLVVVAALSLAVLGAHDDVDAVRAADVDVVGAGAQHHAESLGAHVDGTAGHDGAVDPQSHRPGHRDAGMHAPLERRRLVMIVVAVPSTVVAR